MENRLNIRINFLKEGSYSNVGAELAEKVIAQHLRSLLGLALNISLTPYDTHEEVYQALKNSQNTESELGLAIVPTSSTDREGFILKAANEVFADNELIPLFGIPVDVEQYPAVAKPNQELLNGKIKPEVLVSHPAALTQVANFIEQMDWNEVKQTSSNSTAEGLEIVSLNPDSKLVGFGRKETAQKYGLSIGDIASKSITRMSLVAQKKTPTKILSALERIAKVENKTNLTNVIISGLKFEKNESGQLYKLLTSLERFGDIRYANLQNNPSTDYITCTISSEDSRFLMKNLEEIKRNLSFNVHYIPVLGDNVNVTGDVFHEANVDTSGITYRIKNQNLSDQFAEISLEIPDESGSLLELLYRVKQERINLDYLTTQIMGNENQGEAVIKFKNTNNEAIRLIKRLTQENITEFEQLNIKVALDKYCLDDLNTDQYKDYLKNGLTRNEYEELKKVALYNPLQNASIPPNLSLRIQRKFSAYAIQSMINGIRKLAFDKIINIGLS